MEFILTFEKIVDNSVDDPTKNDKIIKKAISNSETELKLVSLKILNFEFLLSTLNVLNNLKILNLNNNKLKTINLEFLPKNLEKLYLSYNQIEMGDFFIDHLPNLNFIDLTCNNLKNFTIKDKSGSLRNLNLSLNKLTEFDFDYNLDSIENINLSCNKITKITGTCNKIKNLFLRNNKLINFNFKLFSNLENLSIYNNKIESIYFEMFPLSLQTLNLGRNNIKYINFDINFLNLKKMNLSNNFLMYIDWSHLPKNLQELLLKNNRIERFGWKNCPKTLRYLNLNVNSIKTFTFKECPKTLEILKIDTKHLEKIEWMGSETLANLKEIHIPYKFLVKNGIIGYPSTIKNICTYELGEMEFDYHKGLFIKGSWLNIKINRDYIQYTKSLQFTKMILKD